MSTPITSRPSTPVLPQEEALDEHDLLLDPYRRAVYRKKGECMDAASSIHFGSAYGDLHKTTSDIIAGKIKAQNAQVDSAGNICARKVEDLETLLSRSGMHLTPILEARMEDPMRGYREQQIYGNMAIAHGVAAVINQANEGVADTIHTLQAMQALNIPREQRPVHPKVIEAAQKVHDFFTSSHNALPEIAEKYYGIPRSLSEQYVQDVGLVNEQVAYGICLGAAGRTVGLVRGALKLKPIDPVCPGEMDLAAGTFSRSKPQHAQGLVDIYHRSLQNSDFLFGCPSQMSHAVGKSTELFRREIPNYSALKDSSQRVWEYAIRRSQTEKLFPVKIDFFRNDATPVAKLSFGKEAFVVIESPNVNKIANRLIGLDFLRSLKLQHTTFPQLVTVGQHNGRYFIARSLVEGNTFSEQMIKIGNNVLGSTERSLLMQDFLQASEKAGLAMGEYQSAALSRGASSYEPQVIFHVQKLKGRLTELERFPGIFKIRNLERYEKLLADFQREPGTFSYGYREIQGGHFTWSSQNRVFGHIDAELVGSTFSVARQPLSLAAAEYRDFLRMYEVEGRLNRLRSHETSQLQDAFRRGYQAEFRGTRSAAAERFFEIDSLVDKIRIQLLQNPASINIPNSQLNMLIRELDTLLP